MRRCLLIFLSLIILLVAVGGIFINRGVKKNADLYGFPIADTKNSIDDDFRFLLDKARENTVFMYGESHGIAENEQLVLRLLKFLHREAGYRYLALESDFAYTHLLNQYLATGDETYLLEMDKWYYNNSGRTRESYEFYRSLYNFNRQLPEKERIVVWCTDVAHGSNYTIERINQIIENNHRGEEGLRLAEAFEEIKKKGHQGLNYQEVAQFEEQCQQILGGGGIKENREFFLLIRSLKDLLAWTKKDGRPEEYPEGQDIRERSMLAYYEYFFNKYDPERTGKVLAYNGSYHIKKQNLPENNGEVLAIFLNEQFSVTKGKVFSLLAIPATGSYRNGNGQIRTVKNLSFRLKIITSFLPKNFTLFYTEQLKKLGGKNTFYSFKSDGVELSCIYDAVIVMKNVTPETDLELERE